jgi:DNA polymerase-3 subunit gamma/tau
MTSPTPNDEPAATSSARDDEYVVVARRYRPQTFEELIGQEHSSRALANAIATNRVGHAYLFTGARGVGKTSAARIFAKALNCATGPTANPCNRCDFCSSISSGDDVDVIEIDGASNRGIDEIRQLRSNVNVRPSRSRFKIYIIDEVHMLTTPAFNALLKTLEEPPEHVKFIFCTTDPEKIPITVLSRCQRFDFSGIRAESIASRLRQICESEGATVDEEALRVIARRAAGSMRDSQSLLEQLLAFGGDHISVDEVHSLMGTAKGSRLETLVSAILKRNAAAALADLDAAIAEGADAGQIVEQLLGHFRDMMVVAVGGAAGLMLYCAADDHASLKAAADRYGVATILAAIQTLDQSLVRMRQSTHTRTLAEMAVVRLCQIEDLQPLASLAAHVRDGSGSIVIAASQAARAPASLAFNATPPTLPPKGSDAVAAREGAEKTRLATDSPSPLIPHDPPGERLGSEVSGIGPKTAKSPPDAIPSPATSAEAEVSSGPKVDLNSETISRVWRQVLDELGDMTADFAARASSIAISAPNTLVVSFPARYTSHKSFCEDPQRRSRLEQAVQRVTGQKVAFQFEITGDSGDVEATKAPIPSQRELRRGVEEHPLVKEAAELFDGQVVRVDEPRKA